jgi:hypothetical protein
MDGVTILKLIRKWVQSSKLQSSKFVSETKMKAKNVKHVSELILRNKRLNLFPNLCYDAEVKIFVNCALDFLILATSKFLTLK